MSVKNESIKKTIQEYSNMYTVIANIAISNTVKYNFNSIIKDYNTLKNLYDNIMDFIDYTCPKDIANQIKDSEFNSLPQYLEPIKTVETYRKILALKYANIHPKSVDERIILNKISIELNPSEEFPYINIANILFKRKKYPEVIEFCNIKQEFADSPPILEILGKTYRKTGELGKSIDSYKKYLETNKNDTEAADCLNKIYKEALNK